MIENHGRTNSTDCPAPDSDDGARDHGAGEDAPETRQDLVVVTVSKAAVIDAVVCMANVDARSDVSSKQRSWNAHHLFQAIQDAPLAPPPDRAEHVGRSKEGGCQHPYSYVTKYGQDSVVCEKCGEVLF